MTTIITIASSDLITNSRTDINTNFSNLNSDKIETSYIDTDTTLAANSDSKIATQKATKAYVDANVNPTGRSWNEYAASSAGTDTYAITLTGLSAYATGQTFKFKADVANTGACSLNVNGLGAKAIKKNVSSDPATGDILANQEVVVMYDGTNMQLISSMSGLKDATQLTGILPIANGGTGVATAPQSGATTKDMSVSTTTTIAHGLSVTPKIARITAVSLSGTNGTNFAYTVYTNAQSSVYTSTETGTGTAEAAGATFRLYKDIGAGSYIEGVVTVDATNIYITWTLTNTPSGTAYLTWEAE